MRKYLSILMLCFGASIPMLVVAGVEHMGASITSVAILSNVVSYTAARTLPVLPVVYARTIIVRTNLDDAETQDGERVRLIKLSGQKAHACHRDHGVDGEIIAGVFRQAWSQQQLI